MSYGSSSITLGDMLFKCSDPPLGSFDRGLRVSLPPGDF